MTFRWWLLLLLLSQGLPTGCATRPVPRAPVPDARTPSAPAAAVSPAAEKPRAAAPAMAESRGSPSGSPVVPIETPVVVALLEESDAALTAGDSVAAGDALERALRIEPRNARLWHRLAALRLQQGETALAADLARRSSSLAEGDQGLIDENDQLITRTGEGHGDDVAGEASGR